MSFNLPLPQPGTRWLVGVSGGGDSMALLHLLVEAGWGPDTLTVAHFNHNWSPWGATAEAFVRAQCAQAGLPYEVGLGAGKAPTNAEAQARHQRQAFFQSVAARQGAKGLFLAHTQTDVLESFLIRAGKGSGLTGLTSLTKKDVFLNNLKIVRPLLEVTREDLRAYLQAHNHPWLEDPADAAGQNQRARVRQAAPLLRALGLTPEGLTGCIANLARAEAALEAQTEALWAHHAGLPGGGVRLPLAVLRGCQPEFAQRLLARALAAVGQGLPPRSSKRLALLARIAEEPTGKATLGTATLAWKGEALDITPQESQA